MAPGLEREAVFEDVRQPPGERQQAPSAAELTSPLGLVNHFHSGEISRRQGSEHTDKQIPPAAARCLQAHQLGYLSDL